MIPIEIECILEYHNMHRLVIERVGDGFYTWRVSFLDDGDYYVVGGIGGPVSLDCAIEAGRRALAVWSEAAQT